MFLLEKVSDYFQKFPNTYFSILPLELLYDIYVFAEIGVCKVPYCCCGQSIFKFAEQKKIYF